MSVNDSKVQRFEAHQKHPARDMTGAFSSSGVASAHSSTVKPKDWHESCPSSEPPAGAVADANPLAVVSDATTSVGRLPPEALISSSTAAVRQKLDGS